MFILKYFFVIKCVFRVQPFQRRRKYRLFVGFLEGTMIHPVDAPVEFEISIGKSK